MYLSVTKRAACRHRAPCSHRALTVHTPCTLLSRVDTYTTQAEMPVGLQQFGAIGAFPGLPTLTFTCTCFIWSTSHLLTWRRQGLTTCTAASRLYFWKLSCRPYYRTVLIRDNSQYSYCSHEHMFLFVLTMEQKQFGLITAQRFLLSRKSLIS